MRGVKRSGKAKLSSEDKALVKQINYELKGPKRKYRRKAKVTQGVIKEPVGKVSREVKMTPAKIGNLTELMTVSVGARATIRVGDHEFLSPDITFHNLDPRKDLDKQMAEGIEVIDKAWSTIIKQMHLKMESFIREVQG
jgi:hypothetical protein